MLVRPGRSLSHALVLLQSQHGKRMHVCMQSQHARHQHQPPLAFRSSGAVMLSTLDAGSPSSAMLSPWFTLSSQVVQVLTSCLPSQSDK